MSTGYSFSDRRGAGCALARALSAYAAQRNVLVLALPRGGVPVGFEVARALRAPLDIFAVRKLGVPGQEELAMGAVASGGITIVDERLISMLGLPAEDVQQIKRRELEELHRREIAYRDDRPRPSVSGKTVIVVDDGLATGSSMRAAVEALREQKPARIVAAVPVGAPETCERLRYVADDVICVLQPPEFGAVGAHYRNFRQTSDDEVRALLAAAAAESRRWSAA